MSVSVQDHVIARIEATPIQRLPSPHFHVDGVFPADFYEALLENFPGDENFQTLAETGRVPAGTYPERSVFLPDDDAAVADLPSAKQAFWQALRQWFMGEKFLRAMAGKFPNAVSARFGALAEQAKFYPEALVVRDRSNYAIGPHTDAPHRLVTMLFYCPRRGDQEHLGTSLFVPRERGFTSPGGPHYDFDKFVNVATMPYRPNSLFCFLNTNAGFHGVETITDENVIRDMLLYVLRIDSPKVPYVGVGAYDNPALR